MTFTPAIDLANVGDGEGVGLEMTWSYAGETLQEVELWASLRPFTARDQLRNVEGGPIQLTDARWVTRAEAGPWAVGQTFVDDTEAHWTIQGVAPIQRGFIELLARRVG